MKKRIFYFLLIINFQNLFSMPQTQCPPLLIFGPQPITMSKKLQFKPTAIIHEKTADDEALLNGMKPLFFETNPKNLPQGGSPYASKKELKQKILDEYGGREITLTTRDGFNLSTIYVKRPNAPITIIYVTGYHHNYTPPKEWPAPFIAMFPHYNILMFDWRGFGESQGFSGFGRKNDFGPDTAYLDIQAAIDWVRQYDNNPIMLHGFCFGGAMAMLATINAAMMGWNMPDALGLCSIFPEFECMYNNAVLHEKDFCPWLALKCGIAKCVMDCHLRGDMFAVKPIEMIHKINNPCWFDHFTDDTYALFTGGQQVFNACTTPKFFLEGKKEFIPTLIQAGMLPKEFITTLIQAGMLPKEKLH